MQQLQRCSWNLSGEMSCISQVLGWCHSQQPGDSISCFFRTGKSQPANPSLQIHAKVLLIGCSKLLFCINESLFCLFVIYCMNDVSEVVFFFLFFSIFLEYSLGKEVQLICLQSNCAFIGSHKVVQYLVNSFSDNRAIPAFCEQMGDTFSWITLF